MPGSVTLVTGASADIGLSLIRRLLLSEPGSLILAHHHQGGERLAALQAEMGPNCIQSIQADFSQNDAARRMAQHILNTVGPPNKFVHLPALKLVYERFPASDWTRFQQDLNVQLLSAVSLLQQFLPRMSKLQHGRVVFLTSTVTRGLPPKYMAPYTVAKYAQLGLVKALAAEYASTNVTVNAVSPTMVETRFLDEVPSVATRMSASANPKGRNATPEDIIGAIEFLLSERAGFITGIEMVIAGGAAC
ncbi:MAG: SDR family oxidoreductase [Candidatus Acidiferrum sp.]